MRILKRQEWLLMAFVCPLLSSTELFIVVLNVLLPFGILIPQVIQRGLCIVLNYSLQELLHHFVFLKQ